MGRWHPTNGILRMAFYHMYVQWVVFYTIVLLTELFSIGDLEEVVGRGSVGGFIRGSVGGSVRGVFLAQNFMVWA